MESFARKEYTVDPFDLLDEIRRMLNGLRRKLQPSA